MIYLYAITAPLTDLPMSAGLEGAELRLARAAEVAGLYSVHAQIDARPQPDTLWRHEQVVEAAMETGPTLPVRFGTTFEDSAALVSSLEGEGRRLRAQLNRVQGCVELAVRVGLTEAGPSERTAEDGRGYLEAKLVRRRQEQAIIDETLGPLRELAVREQHGQGRSASEMVCASYLVRSDQVGRFSKEAALLAERNPQLWLSCTGPWPPYSFAEEAA